MGDPKRDDRTNCRSLGISQTSQSSFESRRIQDGLRGDALFSGRFLIFPDVSSSGRALKTSPLISRISEYIVGTC